MFLSVVIPTYNRRPILEKCLQALENQDLNNLVEGYEVIVVDDGSTDGTPEWLNQQAKKFPHVRLIVQEHGALLDHPQHGVELP